MSTVFICKYFIVEAQCPEGCSSAREGQMAGEEPEPRLGAAPTHPGIPAATAAAQ